jgi:hypothetical protein
MDRRREADSSIDRSVDGETAARRMARRISSAVWRGRTQRLKSRSRLDSPSARQFGRFAQRTISHRFMGVKSFPFAFPTHHLPFLRVADNSMDRNRSCLRSRMDQSTKCLLLGGSKICLPTSYEASWQRCRMWNGKGKSTATSEDANGQARHPLAAHADFRPACKELLKALEYARGEQRDVWDFAVEIRTLREAGLTDADFRWLACLGHVEHACEVTHVGDDRRQFKQTGKLSFARRECFVLTDSGAAFARSQLNAHAALSPARPSAANEGQSRKGEVKRPIWDSQRRELRLDDTIVKQFKWPAVNQEIILAVFQEVGWLPHIDDPLPPQAEQDPKRRLHDTIKCLNRNQKRRLIRFSGDGTGEGVLWTLNEQGASIQT